MNAQAWTAVLRPADGTARERVVAFPHAGAGLNALLPVLNPLPSTTVPPVSLRRLYTTPTVRALTGTPESGARADQ